MNYGYSKMIVRLPCKNTRSSSTSLTAFSEHDFLDIAPCLHHRRRGVSMIHGDHALGDNRPGVEIVGDDMRRRADDLYTPLVCLMVRLGADKGR